jgi:16S rRNA G966 N2-methylase RsmD
MIYNRIWEMPNKNTFDIKCIKNFINKYNKEGIMSIDPFANTNRIAKITNDLDPEVGADYNMDAIDFLKQFEDNSIDLVLFDPPIHQDKSVNVTNASEKA